MLGDTFAITYNAVAKTLQKVSVGNYTATYYLDDSANHMIFTASVKHTIPGRGQPGESHLVRLDVQLLDASGVLLRTVSSWIVIRTDDGTQDTVQADYCVNALLGWASTGTNIEDVVARES